MTDPPNTRPRRWELQFHSGQSPFRHLIECCSSSLLVSNTGWALAGYGLRLLIQAAFFVILLRSLGVEQYGGFIATVALINVASPFVGLGSGIVLIKNVARDKSLFAEYWGNGLLMTLISGVVLLAVLLTFCRFLLPPTIPVISIVCIALSDLIFVKLLDMAIWAFQAVELLFRNAQLNVLISLTRLTGIVALALAVEHPTIVAWSAVYLVGSIVAALIAVTWATFSLGKPTLALGRIGGRETVEGLYFSVSLSTMTIYNDIDKTMLARFSTLEAAGIYGAAYRLVDVAFLPVTALLSAAFPGFFRCGKDGIHATRQYGQRLMKRILPYSLFASAALLLGAPMVPLVLGYQYVQVAEALRWLAALPLLKTLHYFVADSLTGAGHQGPRTLVQVGVAVFNVLVNMWLIPAYGWRGAAWSSMASDALLGLALLFTANRLARKAHLRVLGDTVAATGPV